MQIRQSKIILFYKSCMLISINNIKFLFWFRLADGDWLHRASVTAAAVVRAASVCLAGLGATAGAFVL